MGNTYISLKSDQGDRHVNPKDKTQKLQEEQVKST